MAVTHSKSCAATQRHAPRKERLLSIVRGAGRRSARSRSWIPASRGRQGRRRIARGIALRTRSDPPRRRRAAACDASDRVAEEEVACPGREDRRRQAVEVAVDGRQLRISEVVAGRISPAAAARMPLALTRLSSSHSFVCFSPRSADSRFSPSTIACPPIFRTPPRWTTRWRSGRRRSRWRIRRTWQSSGARPAEE